jgi:energy-coupling factor transport system permease protein
VRIVPSYRPGASALHAARAGAGIAFCGSFALVSTLYDNPLVLAGALLGVCAAAAGAGVIAELKRAAWFAVPLAVLIVVVNALVNRAGDTVIFRGGTLFGHRIDVTLEAVQYGGMSALRILVLVSAFALYSATIDPDDVLRLLRRFSYRSALTVSLATRLVPVLQRDAQRISEAARCRPEPPRRSAVTVAAITRALDRAVDVAASLEVRGYAGARRPRRQRVAWSRHDLRVGAAALALGSLAVAGKLAGLGTVDPYPIVEVAAGAPELVLAGLLMLGGAAPFVGARARLGVARA